MILICRESASLFSSTIRDSNPYLNPYFKADLKPDPDKKLTSWRIRIRNMIPNFCFGSAPLPSGSGYTPKFHWSVSLHITLFRIFSCRELFLRFSYIHPAVRTVELVYTSVADPDPGSGIGYLFDPWIRDPGWEEVSIRIRDLGSGMNNTDHIF